MWLFMIHVNLSNISLTPFDYWYQKSLICMRLKFMIRVVSEENNKGRELIILQYLSQ